MVVIFEYCVNLAMVVSTLQLTLPSSRGKLNASSEMRSHTEQPGNCGPYQVYNTQQKTCSVHTAVF